MEKRWFHLQITPIIDGNLAAIASHDNVTPLKLAELKAEENATTIIELFTETVRSIARAIELRDPYTAGHQRNVATICNEIAKRLGLSTEQQYGLQLGATIHDIGKIAVPAEILSRPGKLNEHEYNLIKLHPSTGYEIMKALQFPWPIAEMIYQHHERLDGTGYPRRLTKDFICLEAKILAVADVYDAIISHRPYRAAMARQAAINELTTHRGTRYDPDVIDALLDYISTIPLAEDCHC
jgi:putative nucleotidyltransferase with HDIG domain